MFKLFRFALVTATVGAGLGVLGLVAYSYFFLNQTTDGRVRAETAVNTSQIILSTSQGQFLDKSVPLDPDATPAPLLGALAPDFTLLDLDGRPWTLSQFRGKPVLLNFWATWCPPCRKEMPDLQRFSAQYGDRVQLLGVNWDYQADDEVRTFLDEYAITYPTLMDRAGEVIVRYRLTGLPVTFWIDEAGFIRGLWLGAMQESDILTGFRKITDVLDDAAR